jgi:hypothetical protein
MLMTAVILGTTSLAAANPGDVKEVAATSRGTEVFYDFDAALVR